MRFIFDSSYTLRLLSEGKRPLTVGLRLEFIGEVSKIGSPEVDRWAHGQGDNAAGIVPLVPLWRL